MASGAPSSSGALEGAAVDEDDLEDDVMAKDVAWGDPIIGEDEDDFVCKPCAEQDVLTTAGPKVLPCPKEMSPAAFAKHCLTHLPYSSACPYCVAGKKPNVRPKT